MNYTKETVEQIKAMLNSITVKGIEDCRRIALIAQLLDNPEKENDDGKV